MPTSKPQRAVLVDGSDIATAGWDPYEVWRTRVLLPRLTEHATRIDPRATAAVVPPTRSVYGMPEIFVRAVTALVTARSRRQPSD